jgi:hypothetical protein
MRSLTGELARLMDRMASVQVAWTNTVAALVTSLDAGSIVPDNTGLAGAQPMTREEVITMGSTNFANALTTFNSAGARALYVKTVGPLNAVSG